MKKVLALVLAVIMVCTMAMAVTVGGGDPYTETIPETFNKDTTLFDIVPGAQLVFETNELYKTGLEVTAPYTDKDGNFVAEKNFVEIAFGAGADLVASKGWVKTGSGTGAADYKYVITLKKDDSKLLDNKADLIINSITASVYGNSAKNEWKYVNADGEYAYQGAVISEMLTKIESGVAGGLAYSKGTITGSQWLSKFDVGYAPNYLTLNEAVAKTTVVAVPTSFAGKIVAKAGVDLTGKTMTKGILDLSDLTDKIYVNVEVKHGDSFFMAGTQTLSTAASTKLNRNIADNGAKLKAVYDNYYVSAPAAISIDNAAGYKLYAINTTTGEATLIPTTTDAKGITTATVSTLGYMVLVDGTLTATGAATTPGTTTNPGTGANDVVGVAAALAVVALVSGAAISLKK